MSVVSDRRELAREGLAVPAADPPSPRRRVGNRDGGSFAAEWQLALPLGVFYCAFLFAPLGVLFLVSLFTDGEMTRLGPDQYATFFSERLNYVILLDTLRLGLLSDSGLPFPRLPARACLCQAVGAMEAADDVSHRSTSADERGRAHLRLDCHPGARRNHQ